MSSIARSPLHESSGDQLRRLIESGIDSVVLLGGTVRQTQLRRAIGRHILQLPLDPVTTILSRWTDQVGALARRVHLPSIHLRVLINPDEQFSPDATPIIGTNVSVRTDPNPTRGTGGVLRDLVEGIPDSRWLLVANANQTFVGDPLDAVVRLAGVNADMSLMPAADGNGGFMLLARCECFKGIAPRGFVDLKEQALPAIAKRFDVRVVDPEPDLTPTSIRSLRDYLDLLKRLSLPGASSDAVSVEDWSNAFSIVEAGASVAPGARIHNSVILAGAVVESNAVVARCVVGPGARVAAGEVVRDRFVTPPGEESVA
jgi:hypothetical protein